MSNTVVNYQENLTTALEGICLNLGGTLPTRSSVTNLDQYHLDLATAIQSGGIGGAIFTIGAENANVRPVAIQLTDGNGNALTRRGLVHVYLSNDANGDAIASAGTPAGLAAGTDGLFQQLTANLAGFCTSESDGDIDLNITNTGTGTVYLVVVLPSGKLVVSSAITFA